MSRKGFDSGDVDEVHRLMGEAVREQIDALRSHAASLTQRANDIDLLWAKGDWEALADFGIVPKRLYSAWSKMMNEYGMR